MGMSIGVQDGRIIDPQFGSGSCGPKFKVKNLTTGKWAVLTSSSAIMLSVT